MGFNMDGYVEWRPIPGFEGRYEVSNFGGIRSVDVVVQRRTTPYTHKGRLLSQDSKKYGHRYVVLKVNGKKTHYYVHRAVLEAFAGPCPEGMECRHLDGDAANNSVENLRWGTPAENRADVIRHGNDHQLNKTECPKGHRYGEVYVRPGSGRRERICKPCQREWKRQWKQSKESAA